MVKPVVDRIENQLEGQAEVIHLNIFSPVGREAALRYGVRAQPTLVVVDGCGQAVESYVGIPSARRVIERVQTTPSCTPLDTSE